MNGNKKNWSCPQCGRIFSKANQPHSCKKIPLQQHFINKAKAREIFDYLLQQVRRIGNCKIISLPCCVHLFGSYDFLAALPKKDGLEVRFALDRELKVPRLKTSVQMSGKVFKNCFEISSKEEIDTELIGWIKQAYHLKTEKLF